jgi:hypothetical protein
MDAGSDLARTASEPRNVTSMAVSKEHINQYIDGRRKCKPK